MVRFNDNPTYPLGGIINIKIMNYDKLQITIETNKPAVNLLDLFSEMNCESEGGQNGCVAFKCVSGEVITVLAAKNSREYCCC